MHTRSDFLTAGTLAMLTPAVAGAAPSTPSPAPSPEPSLPPFNFDLAKFDAMLDVAAAHRHVIASTKLAGGIVLTAMRNTLNAYTDIGIPLHDVAPVAVLYHGASICLGFDDTIWNDYFIPILGKAPKGNDMSKDFDTVYDGKTRGNPCLHKQGGREDTSIESLVADAGARFFICNNATEYVARSFATRLAKPAAAVYADFESHLVPNGILVPAGVWAVLAIQERRYTMLQTSL